MNPKELSEIRQRAKKVINIYDEYTLASKLGKDVLRLLNHLDNLRIDKFLSKGD